MINSDLKKEWSSKNGINIERALSRFRYIWECEKGHEWVSTLGNRKYQNTGCPYCNSKKSTTDNNLMVVFPEVASEWDYNKNELKPENFLPYSNKRAHWVCSNGHKWSAVISNRTSQNNKCPVCFKNESWCENYIFSVFSSVTDVLKLNNPEIDIYLKDFNVGIEYDGYYHKFRYELDVKKNIWAEKNLNFLIRIREYYLPKLPQTRNMIVINQDKSNKDSCKKSIMEIAKILKIDVDKMDFDASVELKIRNLNLPDDLIKSWSPNNNMSIKYALKTHKYLWVCNTCGSEYTSELRNRIKKDCCPFCSSQKVNSKNSLASTNPEILDYISSYNEISPESVTVGTAKKLKFFKNGKEIIDTPRNFLRRLKKFNEFNSFR